MTIITTIKRPARVKVWKLRYTKQAYAAANKAMGDRNKDKRARALAEQFFQIMKDNDESGVTRDQATVFKTIAAELNLLGSARSNKTTQIQAQ